MARDETLKVATFNVNSIRSRLEPVLHWLQAQSPDVLCLQETRVQDAEFPAQAFHDIGYHVIFRGQKAYGGVALASREAPQEVVFGFDDGDPPAEDRLIRAVVRGIPVVNTYVPQGRSPDSPHFQEKLVSWLSRGKRKTEPALGENPTRRLVTLAPTQRIIRQTGWLTAASRP